MKKRKIMIKKTTSEKTRMFLNPSHSSFCVDPESPERFLIQLHSFCYPLVTFDSSSGISIPIEADTEKEGRLTVLKRFQFEVLRRVTD